MSGDNANARMAVGRMTAPASARAVLRNWAWLLGAQVLVRVVALGYKVFLARALHAEGYGLYAWVLATVALFSMLSEAGLNRLLIRDIGREPERGPGLVSAVTRLRLGLAALAFAVMVGVFLVTPTDRAHFVGLCIAGATLFLGAAGLTFDAALYGIEQARYSGVGQILVTVAGAVFGVAAVLLGLGLPGLFASVGLAEGVRVAYLYARLGRCGLRPAWDQRIPLAGVLRDAVPYAALGVLGMVYFRIDTVMLAPMRGDAEAGIYTVAFKLFEVLLFVPGTLAAVVLPRMARYHTDDADRLRASHIRLTRLLAGAAVPVAVGLWVASPLLVETLFGAEYAASVPVLRLLAVTFVFHCLHTPNATLVLSGSVLAPVVWLSVYTAGCNVLLNAYFIPRYGAPAAAATTLASEIISWVIFTAFIHQRIVRLHGWSGALARPAVAAAGAAVVGFALRDHALVALCSAGAAYALLCGVCGVVGREDVALLRRGPASGAAGADPVDLG